MMAARNRDAYGSVFNSVRSSVLERDGNCCVKCGSTFFLEVHHIEGYKHNEPELLATLCRLCHGVAPMGKDAFEQWKIIGEMGVDVIRRRLVGEGGPKLRREDVQKIYEILINFGLDINKLKMKAGRDKIRQSGNKCEGRKNYGTLNGESEILDRMKELSRQGNNSGEIAKIFNTEGLLSRYGKRWLSPTISKILSREEIIERVAREPEAKTEDAVVDLESDDDPDSEFWREVRREIARGPIKRDIKGDTKTRYTGRIKLPPYILKKTRNGRILIPTSPMDRILNRGWHP